MKRNNLHTAQAEIVTGYELDEARGWFSIILPEASTNLCVNPSLETNTTGWSAMAGTLSRVSTYQRRGTYSLRCAPTAAANDGCYFGATAATLIPTTLSNWYTLSIDFKGAGGYPYQLYFADQWGTKLNYATCTFYATGDWQRVSVPYYETQTTSRRFYITKNNSSNIYPFYVDGAQVENKAYATTYFDGDSVGYVTGVADFYWTGARHASISARSAQTGAGGKAMKLKDLAFTLMAVIGLGMAPMQPISQDYGWQDGALYQRTRKPVRDFTLVGQMEGQSLAELHQNRAALMQYLSPDRTATHQPLLLQYEYANELGEPTGEVLNIPSVYRGGLEGQTDNLYSEKVPLNFTAFMPLVQKASEEGASLGYQATLLNAAYSDARINGQWQALGTGFNGLVNGIRVDANNGRVWYYGNFTTASGIVVNGVCYWDIKTQTFVAIGGGAKGVSGGQVYGGAVAINGDFWIFGSFNAVDGAATKGIGRWNAATNTITPFNLAGTVTAFYGGAIDHIGKLYAWGLFTNWDGDANQDYITTYSTAGAWAAVAADPFSANEYPARGNCGAIDQNNNLIIGALSLLGSGALRKYDGTAWTTLGTSNANILAVYIAEDSQIYVGGDYTTIAGLAVPYISRYNGTTFYAMGTYVGNDVVDISGNGSGLVFVAGQFSAFPVIWNGSAWVRYDITTPSLTNLYARWLRDDVYLGWTTQPGGATSTIGYLNTLTNTGSENVNPIITFTGPGTVYWIRNEGTKDLLYFDLILQAGEVATLNLASGNISFTSNFRGNILSTILPGSNTATFKLLPGANVISVFVAGTTSAATAVDMRWTPQYLGLER